MTNEELIQSWPARMDRIGLKQKTLAQKIKLSPSYLCGILNGLKDPKAKSHVDKIEFSICLLEKKYHENKKIR